MEEKKEETQQPPQQPILEQLKEYAETRFALSKYKAIEKSTSVAASLVTDIIVAICGVLFFLFATFTLALGIGSALGAAWKGFGIVALLYLVIALVFLFAKVSIRKFIVNLLISKIFK
ncbi:phage holin family protein [Mucilaginibacter lacusdianchii]|uniref:phage holin family protein n=1 Tax=Mucilaginibacter lacusdianchii TaxID=2684211 RepID=UPI00131D376F|nr:phage holin family protein [Mucilaginibacter sp. JXJ CY 39]